MQLRGRHLPAYTKGVKDFIEYARNYVDKGNRIKCPRNKCNNRYFKPINMVKAHLEQNGMEKTYTRWVFHGEDFEEMSEDEDDDGDVGVERRCDGLQEMLADVCAGSRFLPPRHAWRGRYKDHFDGNNECRLKPKNLSGDEVFAQLERVQPNKFGSTSQSFNGKAYIISNRDIKANLLNGFKNVNRLHSHYKRFDNHVVACQKPYEGVSQEDWEMCCNRFCSDDFQKVSKKNYENRQQLKVNHCAGSKSFVQYLHETCDAPIGRIELWKKTHHSLEKGWSTLECQLLYEKMIRLQSHSTKEDSTPLTDDEICKRVLGTRPGYVRGLGHGVVAPPSSSIGLHNDQRVEELTNTATVAERQAQRLTEQLQQMEAQMEAQRQQMEA
ncbi:hypothetical protein MRB53_010670 [Persea americana]|uniref:Uncharacterized protein n=1 Tax=Persea americana TaxID=3435 RepID=A0ACC2LT79_PERAE|nr:hypothetical protein MRB53_010670 [Persea americana]